MMKYPICNHRGETAPKIFGKTFVLCWRCTGVMLSLFLMVFIRYIINISFGMLQVFVGVIMMLPILIDGCAQYFCKYESTNLRRVLTGILFGIGFSLVVFKFY